MPYGLCWVGSPFFGSRAEVDMFAGLLPNEKERNAFLNRIVTRDKTLVRRSMPEFERVEGSIHCEW